MVGAVAEEIGTPAVGRPAEGFQAGKGKAVVVRFRAVGSEGLAESWYHREFVGRTVQRKERLEWAVVVPEQQLQRKKQVAEWLEGQEVEGVAVVR